MPFRELLNAFFVVNYNIGSRRSKRGVNKGGKIIKAGIS